MTLKEWARKWKELGPELEEIRKQDIRNSNTAQAILSYNMMFAHAIATTPPKPTSGLIEQQAIFQKIKKLCKTSL